MKTIAAYFGLGDPATRVSPATSIAISLALSLLVSVGLRFLLPGLSPVIRLVLWFVVMVVIFRWAGANSRKQHDR